MKFLEDADFRLFQGDALQVLRELPAESVHMCVTSPPFYGLRDYGTGSWEGGDEGCDHMGPPKQSGASTLAGNGHGAGKQLSPSLQAQTEPFHDVCGKCGARRVDEQIGLEATPDEWVARLVEVFREVRRVLRRDGTLWLEVGDSYNSFGGHTAQGKTSQRKGRSNVDAQNIKRQTLAKGEDVGNEASAAVAKPSGAESPFANATLKHKDLVGAPWLLAFALRADGWYLRSDIVWARPNPMPESVRDRPTKSHSYVFLLSKQPRYFMDMEAVREQTLWADDPREGQRIEYDGKRDGTHGNGQRAFVSINAAGRNLRSVWTIPTEPLPDEHYAAYPQKLVERCILAGTSERGVCPECGAPWERVTDRTFVPKQRVDRGKAHGSSEKPWNSRETAGSNHTETTGWQPTCDCAVLAERDTHGVKTPWAASSECETMSLSASTVPAAVLDPFLGSGTTALVARRLGRRCVGIELSPDYCQMAARRTQQLSLGAV